MASTLVAQLEMDDGNTRKGTEPSTSQKSHRSKIRVQISDQHEVPENGDTPSPSASVCIYVNPVLSEYM